VAPELPAPARAASLLVLALSLVNVGEVAETWFLSRLRSAEIVPLRLGAFVLASAARTAALAGDFGLIWIAASLLVEPALTSLFLLLKARRQIPPVPVTEQVPGNAYLLREAAPLMLSLFAYQIYTRIDQSLVMDRLGADAAGLYSVSTRIIELPMMLSGALAVSLFPHLARAAEGSPGTALERYRPWIAAASLAAWAGLTLLFFFGEQVAGALFGPHYAAAGRLAFLRGLGLVFFINGFLNSTFITSHGLQRILPWNTALGSLCSIPLALLGMSWLGLEGVALAWTLSQGLVLFALNFCWPDLRPFARLQAGALIGRGLDWRRLLQRHTP
jgi:O-antigen/teichoic acid export membrane protein